MTVLDVFNSMITLLAIIGLGFSFIYFVDHRVPKNKK